MVVYAKHTRVSIHSTGHNLVLYLPEQQTTCTHASHSSGWPRCKRRPLRRRRVSDTMCRLGWPACTIHVPYLTLHARQRETAYHQPLFCSRTRSRQGILPWYSRSSRSFPCACAWTRYIRSPLSSVSSPRLRHRSTDTAHRTRTRLESVGPAPTISRPLREVLCRMLQ